MLKTSAVLVLLMGLLVTTVGTIHAITHGQPDAGRHPYVGVIVFEDVPGIPARGCTGSLLSPTVILTAGHCTAGSVAARVWFDEGIFGNPEFPFGGATSYEGTAHTHPDFCRGCGRGLPGAHYRDVGIIVLREPVPTSVVGAYAHLPTAGQVDTLATGTAIDLVGYGVAARTTGGGRPVWTGEGLRRFAPSELVSGSFAHSAEFVRVALNPGGGAGGVCQGDSGGPALLGGTAVVVAVTSYTPNVNCVGVGYASRVDIPAVLTWIASFPT